MIDDVPSSAEKKSRKKKHGRKRIFVCSPLSGAIVPNIALAKDLCRAVIKAGHSPFAPHTIYTEYLDDQIQSDRQAGIECGMAWLRVADEIWVFAEEKAQCSTGMLAEMEWAEKLTIAPLVVWMPEPFLPFKGRGTFNRPTQLNNRPRLESSLPTIPASE